MGRPPACGGGAGGVAPPIPFSFLPSPLCFSLRAELRDVAGTLAAWREQVEFFQDLFSQVVRTAVPACQRAYISNDAHRCCTESVGHACIAQSERPFWSGHRNRA
jgi:hypothetical protein